MRNGMSHRIVGFIANLFPLYETVTVDGRQAARSLMDGTLIFAVDEEEENENGFVLIHWQGDPSRACEALGPAIATLAVARYIDLHAVPSDKRTKDQYAHLSQHFGLKTGSVLVLDESGGDAESYRLLGQLVEKAGVGVAVEILKKSMGL